MGRYRCIDDHSLCDGFVDCPGGQDEDRMSCMFYKTVIILITIVMFQFHDDLNKNKWIQPLPTD